MFRLSATLVLVGAGLLSAPAPASAQFGRPPGVGIGGVGGFGFNNSLPGLPSYNNPFFYVPQYRYAYGSQFQFGNFSYSSYQYYYGVNPLPGYAFYQPSPSYASGSYMTGGSSRSDVVQAAEREVRRAQREAGLPDAKGQIAAQGDFEKGAAAGAEIAPPGAPDALRKALAASNPTEIAAGDSLNEVLREIIRVEAKGAKGASAYVPPQLLDDVRFAGSPAADLLNAARRADGPEFPGAFDEPALAALRDELQKDFAAPAVAVRAGKVPEPAKVAKLEVTFQRVQDAAGPVVKDLPFDEATAARRFLNRTAGAIKAMKGTTANGLIDPKWAVEGLTVADLVKHMTRHKLLFGPAPRGSEEAYTAMHRNLVTYLFVLTQPKK